MSKTRFPAKRLAIDAVLIAMFFALSAFTVYVAGIKIGFSSLPVVLAAVVFGPVDGFLVGFLGEFLGQMLKYGFTATTLLWLIPPAVRGLLIGLACRAFRKHMSLEALLDEKKYVVYLLVCTLSAVVVSLLNTGFFYVDSLIYHYESNALVFGVLGLRIVTGVVSSLLTAIVAVPVMAALRRSRLIGARDPKLAAGLAK